MTRVVQLMDQIALVGQINMLSADLAAAAAARDTVALTRCDHAIRSAVIALIGGGAPEGGFDADQQAALTGAIKALGDAAGMMKKHKATRLRRDRKAALYLAFDAKR